MRPPAGVDTRVAILAPDHVRLAGVTALLAGREGLSIRPFRVDQAQDVIVVVANEMSQDRIKAVAQAKRLFDAPSILIADERIEIDFEAAVDAGVVSAMHIAEATAETIAGAIKRATAAGVRSPGSKALISQVRRIQRFPVDQHAKPDLSYREITLLRRLADGSTTSEVARDMQLSERTVKYLLWRVMQRFDLRNRAHAVAFAIRGGVI